MNNKITKIKKFLKKEGFYVVLFICLCTVATIAAITAGGSKNTASQGSSNVKKGTQINSKSETVQPQNPSNALQVKEELKEVPDIQVQTTTPVSSIDNVKFVKPVTGTIGRAYSEELVKFKTFNDARFHKAMDIKAQKGTVVVAVADGIVKATGQDTEGVYVIIDHGNGLVTKYGNLDSALAVKEGDKITASKEIGKVGNTTNAAYEEYGNYLHFEVMENGKNIDPAKYVNYQK